MGSKLISKHVRMSQEVAEWYENRSKEIGITQTNLMVMALSEYMKQEKTVDVMANMQELMNQLEKMKDQTQK
jgi:hypothetical protein